MSYGAEVRFWCVGDVHREYTPDSIRCNVLCRAMDIGSRKTLPYIVFVYSFKHLGSILIWWLFMHSKILNLLVIQILYENYLSIMHLYKSIYLFSITLTCLLFLVQFEYSIALSKCCFKVWIWTNTCWAL